VLASNVPPPPFGHVPADVIEQAVDSGLPKALPEDLTYKRLNYFAKIAAPRGAYCCV